MITPKDILGEHSGGRVLDAATGSGGFIHFLLEGLKDYTEIIGVDSNERAAAAFAESFKQQSNIRFEQMDALHLDFTDASFDTVSISNSLHHFDDPGEVLHELLRVLRPGGRFILAEMYCDGQSETQMTHVLLHHWWAAIDRAAGVVHNETYRREEMLAMLNGIGLTNLALYDLFDLDEDPKAMETQAELDAVIERYIQRAEGHPELQARGEELRQRVHAVGFHGATAFIAVGTKPEN